jgi:hypothetical protein
MRNACEPCQQCILFETGKCYHGQQDCPVIVPDATEHLNSPVDAVAGKEKSQEGTDDGQRCQTSSWSIEADVVVTCGSRIVHTSSQQRAHSHDGQNNGKEDNNCTECDKGKPVLKERR